MRPATWQGYENFLKASEAIYKVGFEQLGDQPFSHWTDMAKVLPEMVRLEGWRTVWQLACKHVQDPRLRVVLTFQSLLVGGNPFATTSVYCLIAFLERRFGVHFAIGGTGALVSGLVGLIEGQGNVRALQHQRGADPGQGRRGLRRAAGQWRAAGGRCGGLERRFGHHLPQAGGARAPQALDRRQIERAQVFDEPVRLVLRHQAPVPRRGAPHHRAGPALPRAC